MASRTGSNKTKSPSQNFFLSFLFFTKEEFRFEIQIYQRVEDKCSSDMVIMMMPWPDVQMVAWELLFIDRTPVQIMPIMLLWCHDDHVVVMIILSCEHKLAVFASSLVCRCCWRAEWQIVGVCRSSSAADNWLVAWCPMMAHTGRGTTTTTSFPGRK